MKAICVALAFLSLAACSPSRSDDQRPLEVPPDWIVVKAKTAFIFWAPPGTHFQSRGTPMDSFAAGFDGPGFGMDFDYGRYANNLSDFASKPGSVAQHMGVDGKLALFVFGPRQGEAQCKDRNEQAAMYVPDIRHDQGGSVSLMISACIKDARDVPLARAMFRSMRFQG